VSRAALLVVLLVWPLAAFGGASFPTALLFSLSCLVAIVAMRPEIARGTSRLVDLGLAALLVAIVVQLVPVPTALWSLLSPHAREMKDAIALAPRSFSSFQPVSIDPSATAWALAVAAAAFSVFWVARSVFERGGLRLTSRAICTTGLVVSVLAIAQAATAGRKIYWLFPTDHEGPLPFGPFVNRNHFATWVIMAAPLCFGYIAARSDRGSSGSLPSRTLRRAHVPDARSVWLFACAATMVAALLLTLSRSGIVALGAAGLLTILVTRRRPDASRYWWFVAAAAGAVVVATLWSDLRVVADRLATASTGIEGRIRIWRETLPIVRDFWLTGTGAGTYQTAMLLYQQSDRLWYFNQAHHYLQGAAEGGLVLSVPAAVALAAYIQQASRRARADQSGVFWIRSGALCGLAAAALQSIWETGLTMPANAALAAVLAAVAVHDRSSDGRG
jgi:putative inorganic carbon (hco3(-)) transporter